MQYTDPLKTYFDRLFTANRADYEAACPISKKIIETSLYPVAPKIITVVGTNGKGTVSNILSALCVNAGFKVGLFTSPHLVNHNERIRINGEPMSSERIAKAFDQIEASWPEGPVPCNFFTAFGLAALMLFKAEKVDVIVVEAGIGARYDFCNAFAHDLAIITNVALDHEDLLGDLDSIALNKAEIIHQADQVVIGDQSPHPRMLDRIEAVGADAWMLGRDFHMTSSGETWSCVLPDQPDVTLPKMTLHPNNVITAIAAFYRLFKDKFQAGSVRQALASLNLLGRCQYIDEAPKLFLDVAHNAQGLDNLVEKLTELIARTKPHRVIAFCGFKESKAVSKGLQALSPLIDQWCFLTGGIGFYLSEDYQALHRQNCAKAVTQAALACYADWDDAWHDIQTKTTPNDLIVVFGSFQVVGFVLAKTKVSCPS
jgi:dihydrofolate synthase / folylpolyglutamate synthase